LKESKMALTEHLSELRKRIFITLIFIFIAFILTFHYSEEILKFLLFPLNSELQLSLKKPYFHLAKKLHQMKLVFLAPAEAFWMHIKIAFVASFIVSLPVIFHHVWRFITPGLLQKEKKYFLPFLMSATALFMIGAAFCFMVVLPFTMGFLLNYKTENLEAMISIGNYVDFCLKFILAFGAVFELPLIIVFLTKYGVVSPEMLAKQRKYAVLGAFIAAAILTPTPDAFNQTLMAFPIIILYEIGIILSKFIYRKKKNDGS